MPPKKFKAIGFDYMGVAIGQSGSFFNKSAAEFLGVTVDEFKKAYWKHNALLNLQKISASDFWRLVLAELDRAEKFQPMLDFLANIKTSALNEDVLALVPRLKTLGYKVGMLSNNTLEGGAQMRRNGMDKIFDVMLVSAEIGCMKPDREAFELLAEKLGVEIGELVFIDDSRSALAKAEEIGYAPVWFRDYEALVADLRALGVLE